MPSKTRKKTMKMAAWVKLAKALRSQRPWVSSAEYVTAQARAQFDRQYADKVLCVQFEMICLSFADMLEEDDPTFKNCKREFFATCGLERSSTMDTIRNTLQDPTTKPWE